MSSHYRHYLMRPDSPGEGYELVPVGAILTANDEVYIFGTWIPVKGAIGKKVNPHEPDGLFPFGYYRRRLNTTAEGGAA